MAVFQLDEFDHAVGFARKGGYPSRDVVESELFTTPDSGTMRTWITEKPIPRKTNADQVDALRASWLLQMDTAMKLTPSAAEVCTAVAYTSRANMAWGEPLPY